MYIHVNGKNLEITDAIKAYVKEKLVARLIQKGSTSVEPFLVYSNAFFLL